MPYINKPISLLFSKLPLLGVDGVYKPAVLFLFVYNPDVLGLVLLSVKAKSPISGSSIYVS